MVIDLDLSIVEQGIKDALARQVQNKTWNWIREIKTYGGEFDDSTLAWVDTFPAIWVTFQGSGTPKKSSHNKTEYPVTFVVLVGARSMRNEEAQRHGAGSDIGTFLMLKHVQKLLIGNDLSSVNVKGLAPLELGRTKTIFNTKTRNQSINVLSQEFTTQYTITASDRDREEEATEEDLIRVNVDYYFEPTDGLKDASDLIELKEN
ncbi:phage protein Gp37 [Acinetobacter beijerinckii]|uniref:phage protein Gp37 n=1 Tax=Acinetobacter beijerinckii TaxID=262668 RepID=UPI002404A5A3|nr:phage protein Gp37 [Acinetobacter beijerinckii]